jgi:hypothetical protein
MGGVPVAGLGNALESSCELYLEVLRTDKQSGLSCSSSRQHAEQADPDCKLVVNCKDAGRSSGD